MAYDEHAIQLLVGKGKFRTVAEFMVSINEDGVAEDVHTYRDNYDDLPPPLKRLDWSASSTSHTQFIHTFEPDKAWKYLRKHAFNTGTE
jgi:hypothetical protein